MNSKLYYHHNTSLVYVLIQPMSCHTIASNNVKDMHMLMHIQLPIGHGLHQVLTFFFLEQRKIYLNCCNPYKIT